MKMSKKLISLKKYLFTAYYDWLLDNEVTPHLLVDATVRGVVVPQDYVKQGQIILSLLPSAIADYECRHNGIFFKARFKGVSQELFVPFNAMEQLISLETGTGFPIGSALEQLDLAPEDEDLYPDEGEMSGPSFELDGDEGSNIFDNPDLFDDEDEIFEDDDEQDINTPAQNTSDKKDDDSDNSHDKKQEDLTKTTDKEDKTPGFTFVDD